MNELTEIRKIVAARRIVDEVKKTYPRFDKILLSKCEHGDQTGIELRADAMESVRVAFTAVATGISGEKNGETEKHTRPDNRRLRNRIYGRLSDADHARLLARMKRNGIATIQDWLVGAVKAYAVPIGEYDDEPGGGPRCPICGRLCETVYRDRWGAIGGCEQCVTIEHAGDAPECWIENETEDEL